MSILSLAVWVVAAAGWPVALAVWLMSPPSPNKPRTVAVYCTFVRRLPTGVYEAVMSDGARAYSEAGSVWFTPEGEYVDYPLSSMCERKASAYKVLSRVEPRESYRDA